MISLDDLKFTNIKFWTNFINTAFPNALDEEKDMTLSELIEESELIDADIDWWNHFTKYYDGVFKEMDGYVNNPETFMCNLTANQILKIEFHPGDTVYYINDRQIACTGGEYNIQVFPFEDLVKYMENGNDKQIFLLLLPLVIVNERDIEYATEYISNILQEIFDAKLCSLFAKCIVYGLVGE